MNIYTESETNYEDGKIAFFFRPKNNIPHFKHGKKSINIYPGRAYRIVKVKTPYIFLKSKQGDTIFLHTHTFLSVLGINEPKDNTPAPWENASGGFFESYFATPEKEAPF